MKAFVIYLPEHEHSTKHATTMLEQLAGYGIDAELFAGVPGDQAVSQSRRDQKKVYPYGIKTSNLCDDEVKKFIRPELEEEFFQQHFYQITKRKLADAETIENMSRPGVIGCFYSHYKLWQKCRELDEPVMIFEDDVKLFRGYYPVEFEDVLILSLGKSSYLEEPQKTFLETPTGTPYAKPWHNFSMPGASGYLIKPHAAMALLKFYKSYWYPADNAINRSICKLQINTYLMGRNTTENEGNVSMTRFKGW
jgi:GR25 family glycosyltransferase involved in LPS biosynthesis